MKKRVPTHNYFPCLKGYREEVEQATLALKK